MEPATRIIRAIGGAQIVADALGVAPVTVYRWTYPRERGGTDGHIPRRYHDRLIEFAGSRSILLHPIHFVDFVTGSPPVQLPAPATARLSSLEVAE